MLQEHPRISTKNQMYDELTITGVNELVHYVVLPPSSLRKFKFRRWALAPLANPTGFDPVKPQVCPPPLPTNLLLMEDILHQLIYSKYPIISSVLYIPGGFSGFLNHQQYLFWGGSRTCRQNSIASPTTCQVPLATPREQQHCWRHTW